MADNMTSIAYQRDFFRFVRSRSVFFRELWRDVPENAHELEDFPIVDNDEYWSAQKHGNLLTDEFNDGIVLTSGGSTSEPKVILRTREEVHQATEDMGRIVSSDIGILPGDRIANLGFSGPLYGIFLGVAIACLYHMPQTPQVHLPITGQAPLPQMLNYVDMFEATVIFGNVFTVSRLAEHLKEQGTTLPRIRLIMFLGESFHKEMRAAWIRAFPNMRAVPAMYSATDTGVLGIPHEATGIREDVDIKPIYRMNRSTVVVELIDDEGNLIKVPRRKGRVFVTNFKVKLQPVIRYPVGDMAQWVDYELGLFQFLGRESGTLRMYGRSVAIASIEETVTQTLGHGFAGHFQTVRRFCDGKDEVSIHFNEEFGDPVATSQELERNLVAKVPAWKELRDIGYLHPLKAEKVGIEDLVKNPNSGKLVRFISEGR